MSDESRKVMLFSPHPDDESIMGALALRLLREMHMNVVNVPVTYGGNIQRRKQRLEELKGACRYLGFEILDVQEDGLSHISEKGKKEHPDNWNSSVEKMANIIGRERPCMIFIPHRQDFNTTHVGTNELVLNSLFLQEGDFRCYVVEWEYWGPIEQPNLLLEVSRDYLAELITALSFHVGEVKRNPQHINLPAWMHDNVRRGSELVGGQGCAVPDFEYATVYRILTWQNRRITSPLKKGQFLSSKDELSELFV